jgi:hypothetical protein
MKTCYGDDVPSTTAANVQHHGSCKTSIEDVRHATDVAVWFKAAPPDGDC